MFLPVLFAGIISLACTKAPEALDPPGKKQPTEAVNKTMLLRLVNEVRSKGCQCGDTWYNPAPALNWNDQLEQAAVEHSNDMQKRKYFAHFSPEGDNAGERIDRAGYKWMAFGENIGMGYKDEAEVIEAWKKSPTHCKNMMSANFREMGVGRAGLYWTQKLAQK